MRQFGGEGNCCLNFDFGLIPVPDAHKPWTISRSRATHPFVCSVCRDALGNPLNLKRNKTRLLTAGCGIILLRFNLNITIDLLGDCGQVT